VMTLPSNERPEEPARNADAPEDAAPSH
jgi:hypothetical protein